LTNTFTKHTDLVTCCAWLPSGDGFISGSVEKNLYQWRLDGSISHQWSGFRTMDVSISSDGKKMVACCEKKIRVFDLQGKGELYSMQESDSITSIALSSDNNQLLVNLSISEIHLWDLKEKRVIKKYLGQKQGRYVIRGCLGGFDENFVLSGSEDSNVYVWHRDTSLVIERLSGHSGRFLLM
jgi:WD repeat-containing protein 26